ncbi:MAG: LytR C-terminal domain-containing protein [Deltaproteobacteria bacterium]|nr:MAG: LytR C-terminal domain-containing protein [Deltaproteobacteria bacterium]
MAQATQGTKDEAWIEKERLRLENAELQRQIAVLNAENQRIIREHENKMARLKTLNQLLNKEIEALREENRGTMSENLLVKRKQSQLQSQKELATHEQEESRADVGSLKIKVLSGDGNLASAQEMAKRLGGMGYKIKAIDLAPQSSFSRDTVYFTSKSRQQAKRLLSRLGSNAVLKPLTWPSVFDLIIVTGRNQ